MPETPGVHLPAGAGDPADTGGADPALAAALAAYAGDPVREPEVLAALPAARLLVPVVAEPGASPTDEAQTGSGGLRHETSSALATVLMRGADGRMALLAFTCLETLHRWDPAARPVPVPAPIAARAALQDGASAILLDPAGPVRFVVEIAHRDWPGRGIVG